jgi:hypothetical protein
MHCIQDNSTYALMSLNFPKRSYRKILERIIPPPSGGRDKRHCVSFTTALRAWYNSSSKLQCTLFLKLGSYYQLVSLRIKLQIPTRFAQGIIRLALPTVSESQIPRRFASGIVRLTLQTSSRLVGTRFQRVSLKKEGAGKTCPFFRTT